MEVVGLGDAGGGPSGALVRTLGRRSARTRLKADLTLPFRARGRVLLTLDPDMVPGATLAKLFRGRKVVVDVHEDYLKLLNDRAWARASWKKTAAKTAVRVCTFLTKRAHLTVVADEHVPPLAARRRVVVKNLPDFSFLPEPADPQVTSPRAVYIGDVRRSRGLQAMLAAIEGTYTWELDIVGPVHPGDQPWVDQWLANSSEQVRRRVRFHGRLDPQKAWAVADGAWAGLVMLEDTPAFREAVPSKLYEYLAVGLAVVATPLPRMAELLTASGAGEVAADPAGRVGYAAAVVRGLRDAAGGAAQRPGLGQAAPHRRVAVRQAGGRGPRAGPEELTPDRPGPPPGPDRARPDNPHTPTAPRTGRRNPRALPKDAR